MNSNKNNNKIKKRYDRVAPVYDQMELVMEKLKIAEWRKEFWNEVKSNINSKEKLLEAGVGTGKNIPYYPPNIEIHAIDFSTKMISKAQKRAESHNKDINLSQMDIQNLDYPDNFFDLIVSSCVFCSVPDPVKGFKELKRVLKEDGKIMMLEHMRSCKKPWGRIMDMINWIPLHLWGANINRRTLKNIKKAGLKIEKEDELWLDIVKKLIIVKK